MNKKQDICQGHGTEQYPIATSKCPKCLGPKASKSFMMCKKCAEKNNRCHICGKNNKEKK